MDKIKELDNSEYALSEKIKKYLSAFEFILHDSVYLKKYVERNDDKIQQNIKSLVVSVSERTYDRIERVFESDAERQAFSEFMENLDHNVDHTLESKEKIKSTIH